MKPRTRPPIILTAPLTGAAFSSTLYTKMPLTPEQVAEDAKRSFNEGARAIHYHARDPQSGLQCADVELYRRVRELLNRCISDVPISFASSRKGRVETDIQRELMRLNARSPHRENSPENLLQAELVRLGGLEANPDSFTSFSPPEILMMGEIAHPDRIVALESYSELTRRSWRDPLVMQSYYRYLVGRARSNGIQEEMEITTAKSFSVVEQIAADPSLGLPSELRIVILLGFSAHLPITKAAYEDAVSRALAIGQSAGVRVHITVGAAIHPNAAHPGPERRPGEPLPPGKHDLMEVIELVANDPRIESFRAGIEDSPVMYGEQKSNAQLIRHARSVFESLGVEIELDVAETRRIFALPQYRPLKRAS